MDKKKAIFLFTHDFPYGHGEYFIEKEYTHMVEKFDRVIIINTASDEPQTRFVGDNTLLYRYPYHCNIFEKILSFFYVVFSKALYEELKIIRSVYHRRVTFLQIKLIAFSLFKGRKIWSLVRKIIKTQHIEEHDIFLYSYWLDNMAIAIGLIRKKNPLIKGFCRAHRWDVYFEHNVFKYLPLRKFIIENLNAVYCISDNGRNYLNSLLETPYKSIFVSRLGTRPVDVMLKEKSCSDLYIVSISAFTEVKRIPLLIESLACLGSFYLKWVHIGGSFEFEPAKEYAKKLLTPKANITFEFKGELKNEEVLEFLCRESVDVLINVSSNEGIPVSIMEAMSCKIPVIATNVGGISEIVNDENGILLTPESNATEIAGVIEKFYNLPPDTRSAMAESAYRTWENKFNSDKNYSDFYKTVLAL